MILRKIAEKIGEKSAILRVWAVLPFLDERMPTYKQVRQFVRMATKILHYSIEDLEEFFKLGAGPDDLRFLLREHAQHWPRRT